MNGSIYVGQKALSLTEYEKTAPISGVILWVDDENCYEAGDETGTVIDQDCPYATQEMANNLLATLQGYSYQGLEANGAKVSPVAELGDGLTIGGLYTQIAYQNIRFSTGEVMDVAAPGSDETLHEYKTEGQTTKQFTHQIAETRSLISKTSEKILLQVESELKGLSASISVQLGSITSTVQGQGQAISTIQQKVDSIRLSVSNGTSSSTITLTVDGVAVSSQNITFTGVVTFAGLAGGTTTIDGACIKTGTISAQRLNLTGAVSFSDFNTATQNRITGAESAAASAQATASGAQSAVNGWTYPGSTYIDGGKIMTGTVKASTLAGGMIQLLESSGTPVGYFTIASTGAGFGIGITTTIGGIRMTSSGNIWLTSNGGSESLGMADGYISCGADTMPRYDGSLSLGRAGYRWAQVYAAASEIVTSDREEKNAIDYENLARYDALFDALRPCSYRYNNGTSGRTHTGLIAQDVEQAMADIGMESAEFAGFIKEQGEQRIWYALRYEEFIALCIHQIQQLKGRVKELEELL